jgi:di/tricarboxylate transporter
MIMDWWQSIDWGQVTVALTVVAVFVAFFREKLTPDLIAMGAMLILVCMNRILPEDQSILSVSDALGVFANPAPLTIACMFIISAALDKTGVIESLGRWFEEFAGASPVRILVCMMVLVGALSAFVNNTPVVVVFLPIVLSLCRRKGLVASRYLIPLSYASIAGGTCTLVGTSTNILATGIAGQHGVHFSMFSFTILGLVFFAVVFAYLLLVGQKMIPERVTLSTLLEPEESREFFTQAYVSRSSALVGQGFADSPFHKNRRIRVLEVQRQGHKLQTPLNELKFEEGDMLLLKGHPDGLIDVSEQKGLQVTGQDDLGVEPIQTETAVIMEGIVGPHSSLVGKSLKMLNFRQRYGVLILAVHRQGMNLRESFENEKLAFGDTLLVQGPAEKMAQLFKERDFINLTQPKDTAVRSDKAPFALGALLLFVGLQIFNIFPTAVAALLAAATVLFSRSIDTRDAYESVDWKVIFMIFGMIGVGSAMKTSGLDTTLAFGALNLLGENPHPVLLIACIYFLAAILTEVISNNAVAVLLTPVAIEIGLVMQKSQSMDVNFMPLVIAVMFGASASFSTPIGYQTNTFVYGAGGYRFSDFFKVGMPLSVILWITASLLIPVIWPLYN